MSAQNESCTIGSEQAERDARPDTPHPRATEVQLSSKAGATSSSVRRAGAPVPFRDP
jgi:hypothetical protein